MRAVTWSSRYAAKRARTSVATAPKNAGNPQVGGSAQRSPSYATPTGASSAVQREFVPAEAGDEVARTRHAAQDVGRRAQHAVAADVAVERVGELEVIE